MSCPKCPHDENDHVLIATRNDNAMFGGVVLCPTKGCDCYSTWSVDIRIGGEGREAVRIPDRFELEQMKEYIQS